MRIVLLVLSLTTLFFISGSTSAYVLMLNGTVLVTDNATFIWTYDHNSSTEITANKSYIYVDGIYCYPYYDSPNPLTIYVLNWGIYNISLDVDLNQSSSGNLTLVFAGLPTLQKYCDNNYQYTTDEDGGLIYTIDLSERTEIRIKICEPISTTTTTVRAIPTPIISTTTKPTIIPYIYIQPSKTEERNYCYYLIPILILIFVLLIIFLKRRL